MTSARSIGAAFLIILSALVPAGSSSAQSAFSFQAAYDGASDGAIVLVPAGQAAVDWPQARAATIWGGSKQVAFECQDPAGLVTFDPVNPSLIVHAANVTIRGRCFRFRSISLGLGDDTARTTSGVVIDGGDSASGATAEAIEVAGAQVTVRNMRFGPSTLCYAQGRTGTGLNGGVITSEMWCDPTKPVEAPYVSVGNDWFHNEPYFHQNAGDFRSEVVWESNHVSEIQTKDAFNLHTGCGLVWQDGGALGTLTFRNNRFERCAVLGVLFDGADGVLFEGNIVGPIMEPFSNTGGAWIEAPDWTKDLIAKGGADYRDWLVRGNSFCHGTRTDVGATGGNVRIESNDLGPTDSPWPFATYANNTYVGASCSAQPPPLACSDGLDNDGDHLIDYPADPGCADLLDGDETDPPPPPPPPAPTARDIFCAEFFPNEKATWAPGKPLAKWAQQNPGEVAAWAAFADAICAGQSPAPPSLATLHGKAIVAAGKEALARA